MMPCTPLPFHVLSTLLLVIKPLVTTQLPELPMKPNVPRGSSSRKSPPCPQHARTVATLTWKQTSRPTHTECTGAGAQIQPHRSSNKRSLGASVSDSAARGKQRIIAVMGSSTGTPKSCQILALRLRPLCWVGSGMRIYFSGVKCLPQTLPSWLLRQRQCLPPRYHRPLLS